MEKRRVGTARFMSRSTAADKGSTDDCGAQVRAYNCGLTVRVQAGRDLLVVTVRVLESRR